MPRSNRPRRAGRTTPRPQAPDRPPRPGGERREPHPDGEWAVRPVTGPAATKDYRCPGCDQLIPVGVPHLVCWPADAAAGVADRRHWHPGCWAARDRRGPAPTRPGR